MRLALFLALVVVSVMADQLSFCDPLDPARCILPYPNNFYLRPNAQGQNLVTLGPNTLPIDNEGHAIDPVAGKWNLLDGFPGITPIITFLGNVSLANVAPYWNIQKSLASDSPTVLLDTVTGEVVPHFAELDHNSDEKGNQTGDYDRMFMIWPAKRLEYSRRYIVALRNLVDVYTGLPVNTSYAFTCFRDNIPTTNPDIELRRAVFADIFARLTKAGWDRSSLQLAWDFTTASQNSITGQMLHMRDDGLARLEAAGFNYSIVSVQNNFKPTCARKIVVSLQVPLYVNSQLPPAFLVTDANNMPVFQGWETVWISIWIPNSVAQRNASVTPSVLQYGHGLFGSRDEANGDYLQEETNEYGAVIVATDWIGLSEEDEVPVALMLGSNITNFRMIPDRCQQGMLNALAAMRLMQHQPFLNDPAMMFGGQPILTPDAPRYYYGNSQGGILGSMYMAVTTDVKRGCVGVPGGPYSLLLPRSADFAGVMEDLLKGRYSNTLDRAVLFGIMQQLWDRADPGGYMGAITTNPLPNTPNHEVLIQHALGDAQVSYVAAYALGRSMGAKMFQSNVVEPNEELFGFEFIPDNGVGNTAVQVTWQFVGVPPAPEWNIPASKATDTHEGPRRQADGEKMMWTFFQTGNVYNFCNGPCIGRM